MNEVKLFNDVLNFNSLVEVKCNRRNTNFKRIASLKAGDKLKFKEILAEWSKDLKLIYPEVDTKLSLISMIEEVLSELKNKINNFPREEYHKILKSEISDVEDVIVKMILLKFITDMKFLINEVDTYFEPINSENKMLHSIDDVFKYIESKEKKRNRVLADIFGKNSELISRWRNGKRNISPKSVLEIKNNMIEKGLEEKRVNTFSYLIYCSMLFEKLKRTFKIKDLNDEKLWASVIYLYFNNIYNYLFEE